MVFFSNSGSVGLTAVTLKANPRRRCGQHRSQSIETRHSGTNLVSFVAHCAALRLYISSLGIVCGPQATFALVIHGQRPRSIKPDPTWPRQQQRGACPAPAPAHATAAVLLRWRGMTGRWSAARGGPGNRGVLPPAPLPGPPTARRLAHAMPGGPQRNPRMASRARAHQTARRPPIRRMRSLCQAGALATAMAP